MSHEYIRRIRITQDRRVMTESAYSDDDEPYTVRENHSLTAVLRTEGLEAAEKEILMCYFLESWQGNNTRYSRAVRRAVILNRINKYEAWEKGWDNPLFRKNLKTLLYKCLQSRMGSRKCCLETPAGRRLKSVTHNKVETNNVRYKVFDNPIDAQIYREDHGLSDCQFSIRFLSDEEIAEITRSLQSRLF